MKIGLINKSKHPAPSYKTSGSSGMDLRASITSKMLLGPGERGAVPTGIYLELPDNIEAQIRPRSGIALKNGVTVVNSPGTIDSDYRGEVAIILINHSADVFEIKDGDRIAQLVISPVFKIEWQEALSLSETKRGMGGFGSTGTN